MGKSRKKAGKAGEREGKHSPSDTAGGDGIVQSQVDCLLSPELMAELGATNNNNGNSSAGGDAVVAATKTKNKGKKRGRGVSSETRELAATISKSKAKKLKQLEDKRLKDGRRAELYRKLESNRMSQEQLSLLQSSKTISQNQGTLRSRIKQAVQRAVAGMALEDAAVKELECHPEVVADVEEALALPVGGALAATRKTAATVGGDNSRVLAVGGNKCFGGAGVSADTGGGGKAGVRVDARAKGKVGEQAATATAGKSPSSRVGVVAASAASSRIRRGRLSPVAPKPVQVVTVARPRSSSGSSMEDSDDADSDDDPKEVTRKQALPSSRVNGSTPAVEAETRVSNGASAASNDAPSARVQPGDTAGEDDKEMPDKIEGSPAPAGADVTTAGGACGNANAGSGSSWAAKMMSSLARVPTSSNKKAIPGSASSNKGSSETRDTGDGGVDQEKNEGDGEDSDAAGVTASYPPPPSWLDGKAPVYHAVKTPLPSTSGDGTTTGVGGKASSSGGVGLARPERWVPVERPVELQAARMQLPVCGMEQEITEAIHDNDTVILCGETGSGKSTQVPQFLYEAGYAAHGLIGVTQPRRVAAVGTAERVAVELGTGCGKGGAVAYQIRYDASGVGEKTRIKFMTDGILLQEVSSDLLLRKYSVVLLDEAHERNLNTDVLLGMLSRSIPLR